jgi:hypothetical protein
MGYYKLEKRCYQGYSDQEKGVADWCTLHSYTSQYNLRMAEDLGRDKASKY